MPYVSQTSKDRLKNVTNIIESEGYNLTSGELNYLISVLMKTQLKDGLSYDKINMLVGVLECAKEEFYRRIAVPYEEEKRNANGDIY